jgi:methylenetetrahydrofolate reductase (NADPH)
VKIRQLYGRGRPVVSFEFFPPRTEKGEEALLATLQTLQAVGPDFVSVTRTGAKPQQATVDLVGRIRAMGLEAAAHVTSIQATEEEIAAVCDRLREQGIENMVALRGDRAADRPPAGVFNHADDLVRFIRRRGDDFCLAGAGHPEGHPECRDLDLGMTHLKAKVDAGVDVVITQLFFENDHYFRFVDRAVRAGVTVPVVAGIMPITNARQIERITELSGNEIPLPLRRDLERVRDDPEAALTLGIDYGTRQCAALLRGGAPGIHFYTLNQSSATRSIFERLQADGLVGAR